MSENKSISSLTDLLAYDVWLESIPISPATGWRWRKLGLIETINIYGRVYVSRSAIARFEARARSGEFAKEHITPKRRET